MVNLTSDTATRLRAPFKTDRYGNTSTERDWPNATSSPLTNISIQPDDSNESAGDSHQVITGWRLISARGIDVDLLPTDRVAYDGMTLEVDGEVGRYRLGGRVHHVEARLRRVTG